MTPLAAAFLVAVLATLVLTPPVRRLAWAVGYLDHPQARKLHTHATALLGGVAVFAATFLGRGAALATGGSAVGGEEVGWLAGGLVALVLGLVDDRFGMRPLVKLAGQSLAAVVFLLSAGGPRLGLGPAGDALLAVLFMVALMNAINFLDNMDGVAGGLVAIALLALAGLALERGASGLAALQLALAGACVGFLRYNLRRASIFLGDAGSLLLGYSLAASAVLAVRAEPGAWAGLGVVLILAYPLFDLVFVVVTRVRAGRPFYQGGRDHSNHRLASVLKCQSKTVQILYALGAALAASGLWVHVLKQPLPALLTSGLWSLVLLAAGIWLSRVPIESQA